MYLITIICPGVPEPSGKEAALGIQMDFSGHRKHHQRAACSFADGSLILVVENDFDADGFATLDEFSDCISAFLPDIPDDGGDLIIRSVETF